MARVDPGTGRFRWLFYPKSGTSVGYFYAAGARAPLFAESNAGPVRIR